MTFEPVRPPSVRRCHSTVAPLIVAAFASAALLFCCPTTAEEPAPPDSLAPAGWSHDFAPLGPTWGGHVRTVATFEGDLLVGGHFFRYEDPASPADHGHGPPYPRVARWDGRRWALMGSFDEDVSVFCILGGRLFCGLAGLEERTAGGPPLFHWDGEAWQPVSDQIAGRVHALCVHEGRLVVGGEFTIAGCEDCRDLAVWDGKRWRSLGRGIGGRGQVRVRALTVHEGDLIAGGFFDRAGEAAVDNVARWDGRRWAPLGQGVDDVVETLVSVRGSLYAGGRFETAGGQPAARVAEWRRGRWRALGEGIRHSRNYPDTHVSALVDWQGRLLAGGCFDRAGRDTVTSLALWDGQNWSRFPAPLCRGAGASFCGPPEIAALSSQDDRLMAVGMIGGAVGRVFDGLAVWDGAAWSSPDAGWGLKSSLCEPRELGGKVALLGISEAGGRVFDGSAVWDGRAWQPCFGTAADSGSFRVQPTLVAEQEGVVVGYGELTDRSGGKSERLARWREDRWEIVSPAAPAASYGYGSRLLAAGEQVLLLGYVGRQRDLVVSVVSWGGGEWAKLPSPTPGRLIGAALLDGDLVVGIQPQPAQEAGWALERWDGRGWEAIRISDRDQLTALLASEDRLLIALAPWGADRSIGGRIEAWNGREWKILPGRFEDMGTINALAMHRGHLVAGGYFTGIDSIACRRLAFLDGATWRPLGGGTDSYVQHLLSAGGSLWCVGSFRTVGDGVPASGVARWDGPLPTSTPLDSLPHFHASPPPSRLRDGWHSHGLDPAAPLLPFRNGRLGDWEGGRPVGWIMTGQSDQRVRPDERRADSPIGVQPLPDGGLRLSVPAGSRSVGMSQRFAVEAGQGYRLSLLYRVVADSSSEATGVLRSRSFGTDRGAPAHLALGDYDRRPDGYEFGALHNGMRIGLEDTAFTWRGITLEMDAEADLAVVSIGVQGSGSAIEIYEIRCEPAEVTPASCLAVVLDTLSRRLVTAGIDTLDWNRLQAGLDLADTCPAGAAATELLKRIGEPRLTIASGSADVVGGLLLVSPTPYPPAMGLTPARSAAIRGLLRDWQKNSGWTEDGILYWRLAGFEVLRPPDMSGASGVLLDLRSFERSSMRWDLAWAEELAGRLATRPVVWGLVRGRDGARWLTADTLRVGPGSGGEPSRAGPGSPAEPSPDAKPAAPPIAVPVVCLVGPGCVEEGTALAMMLRALGVPLVGHPTGGLAGELEKVLIPAGVQVEYPARQYLTPKGVPVTGLAPHVAVEPSLEGDPVLDKGLRVLRHRMAEARAPASGRSAPFEPPDIRVLATSSILPDSSVRYSYEVINGGKTPISSLVVGDSFWLGQNELLSWPLGATADTLPPTSTTCPPGWQVMLVRTEEQRGLYLDWLTEGAVAGIPAGARQGGFSVILAQPDTTYETCSWTVFMSNGGDFTGVLQGSATDGEEVRILPGSLFLGMRQEPERVAWEFHWETSGMTANEQDTVWIDAETCGCGGPRVLTAGSPGVRHGITSSLQSAVRSHSLQWWSDCCAQRCEVTFRVASGNGEHIHASGLVQKQVGCRGRD